MASNINNKFGAFSWTSTSKQPQRQNANLPIREPQDSLGGLFVALQIPKSQTKSMGLPRALANCIRAKGSWPRWTTLSKAPNSVEQVQFIIRTTENYREYAQDDDPETLFEDVSQILLEIRDRTSAKDAKIIEEEIVESMIEVVYGSNYIEYAGLDHDQTLQICKKVFAGEQVLAEDIEEQTPEYQEAIEFVSRRDGNEFAKRDYVIRSRREIIQHARAFEYITNEIVMEDQPLTEALILETHRILTDGVDVIHRNGSVTKSSKYGGVYRSIVVGAGNTNFAVPRSIPKLMQKMIEDFNKDILDAETQMSLDPFYLAAKYSNEFVQIHPFLDGNGRTSRLILNAILLKCVGIVVPIGEHSEARAAYIGIMARAGREMWGGGELAALVLSKAAKSLRILKEKLMVTEAF